MANITNIERARQRANWSVPIRIEQCENDLDTHDAAFERIEKKLDKLNARIYGFIIALTVSAGTFLGSIALHR